jgi:hypothetical protein
VLALLLAVSVGCSSSAEDAPPQASSAGSAPASSAPESGPPRPDKVVVVVFENKALGDVLDSGRAPYFDSLASSAASFTDAHGEMHPSQPNYLALFSGSTHGVTDDRCPLTLTGDNLAGQLLAAGETFTGFAEGLPEPGFTGCSDGDYKRKHNPWVDFGDLPASVNQPLSAMPSDYADLPTVSFVVPDMCSDMHDCDVATGDRWAQEHLAPYVQWATAHDSLLIVTFDEDDGAKVNHIPTIVAGAGVRVTTSDERIDHYSLLRTIEDMYGLSPLGAAAQARPLTGIWSSTGG